MLKGTSKMFMGRLTNKSLWRACMVMTALLLAACGSQQDEKDPVVAQKSLTAAVEVSDIAGFKRLGPVYAGGLPSNEQLNNFAEKGVTTVIDFRRPQEGLEQEQAELKKLGVNYINIPLGRELAPADAQEKFAQAFAASKGEKVLLHCRSGNRVGMMWSLYQINNGVDTELAIEQGRAMGMKSGFEQAVRASLTKE